MTQNDLGDRDIRDSGQIPEIPAVSRLLMADAALCSAGALPRILAVSEIYAISEDNLRDHSDLGNRDHDGRDSAAGIAAEEP